MPAEDLDADFESAAGSTERSLKRAAITPEAFAALPAKKVGCGFFTLALSDGSQRRFRIRLERGHFLPGKRTLARYAKLNTDDKNEVEWETLGTVEVDGFRLFKRWRGTWEEKWAVAIWLLLNGREATGYSIPEFDNRCWLCLRKLGIDSESQRTQLTPTCRKKVFPS